MDFTKALNTAKAMLDQGAIEAARAALEAAWPLAKSKDDRKLAHDFGNRVQAAIFDAYLATH